MEAVVVVRNWEYDLDKVAREVGKRLPKWIFLSFIKRPLLRLNPFLLALLLRKGVEGTEFELGNSQVSGLPKL